MAVRFIIWIVLVLASLVLAFWIGGLGLTGFLLYMDVSSTIIVLLPSVFILFICFSPSEIKTAFAHVFSRHAGKDTDYRKDIVLFSTLQHVVIILGGFGFLSGLIIVIASQRDFDAIGRGLSQSLLSVFYALFINLLLVVPCKGIIRKKQVMQD